MSREDEVVKAEQALHDQVNLLPRRQLLTLFGILSVTLLIAFIDQNGISTTLPTIAADLNAQSTMSWAGTSSLIANTTFQMLYGRLSDIFGRKTVYLAAIASLAVADLLCGLSQNAAMFYVFRGVAGIGGGGVTNLAMIIVSDVVTLEQRGKYQGILGSMVGIANIAGPFLAAAMIERTTWRAFFWMLSPLSVLSGILSYIYLPSKPRTAGFRESVKSVDWLGSFTSSLGVIFLLIPISGGGSYFQWNSPMVISFLAIGGTSLIFFVIVEWKIARLPMMPVAIYNNLVVVVMLAQSFFLGLVYQVYLYYIPLYLQNAHKYSPLTSAAVYIPLVGLQSISSVLSGQYISRMKRYGEVMWVGFGSWTLGAGLTLLYHRNTNPGIIIVPFMLIGIGVGCVFQPTLVALQSHTTKARRAVIISNRNFFRMAGGATGLASAAAVLQAKLRASLPPDFTYLAESTYALPKNKDTLPPEVLEAYMAASHAVFIMMVPLIGICFLGMVFIRDRGLEPMEDRVSSQALQARDEADAEQAEMDGETQNPETEKSVERTVAGDRVDSEKVADADTAK